MDQYTTCFLTTTMPPKRGSGKQQKLEQRLSYLRYVLPFEYLNLPDEWEYEIPSLVNHAKRIPFDVKRRKAKQKAVL